MAWLATMTTASVSAAPNGEGFMSRIMRGNAA
jgi:hypothetical protein